MKGPDVPTSAPTRPAPSPIRLSAPARAFVDRELPPLLARISDRKLNAHIVAAFAAYDPVAIRALHTGSKQRLLEWLDERLERARKSVDPRAVVELTQLLLPPLPGERDPSVAVPSAPAR